MPAALHEHVYLLHKFIVSYPYTQISKVICTSAVNLIHSAEREQTQQQSLALWGGWTAASDYCMF